MENLPTPKIDRKPPPLKWKERIHRFSWQWHSIVMATGACSSLAHSFPYGTGSFPLQVMALAFFLLDLLFFVILCVWAILRCVLFPEDRASILTDPAKSLFIGFFSNGIASLINAALTVNLDWGTGRNTLLCILWGLWWFNCCFACVVAFGLVNAMTAQNFRDLSKVGPVWMVPIITLIVTSSSGGLFTRALLPHHPNFALATTAVSLTMLAIGLSLTMMLTTAFLLRLYLYGPLDATIVLTTFTTLTPLGQGGQSLLLSGQNLSKLFPESDVTSQLTGRVIFSVCICGAYVLWSMGLAWIAVACFSIRRRLASLPQFSITHWCVIVPNGGFALLSLELATVLGSEFFRVFGAIWSCIVFILWMCMFSRSIPAIIDGSMFKPVNSSDKPAMAAATTPAKLESGETSVVTVAAEDRHEDRPPSYASPAMKHKDIEVGTDQKLEELHNMTDIASVSHSDIVTHS